ncbi:MAG TPA: hypothetical protein VIC04_01230 [Terriglobia bacterium]
MRRWSRKGALLLESVFAFATILCGWRGLHAQDATVGVTVPVVVSGGVLITERSQMFYPDSPRIYAGFRATLYPSVKLGSRWFFASAFEVHSTPYQYYEAFYDERRLEHYVSQAHLGYLWNTESGGIRFRIGKMTSAFGSFPQRYDETANPLLDQPLNYSFSLPIRADQLPCDAEEFPNTRYYWRDGEVEFDCGGSESESYGLFPVTLYGLPGAQLDFVAGRLDGRLQITNSSSANPQGVFSGTRRAQWTAGIGYVLLPGLRVGVSGYRGQYMDQAVESFLPTGTRASDYPASAFGVEASWAYGRWSLAGEFQRFEFPYPGLVNSPVARTGYVEVKANLHPRIYAAFRGNYRRHNYIVDAAGARSEHVFAANRQAYEFAIGYHVNHFQTVKIGYEWMQAFEGLRDDVFALQFVTSVNPLSLALK